MFNLLTIIDFGPSPAADAVEKLQNAIEANAASLSGVVSSHVGRTLPGAVYGGHMMWRLAFASEQHYWDCVATPQWQNVIAPALLSEHGCFVDTVAYRPIRSSVSADGQPQGAIWRCLVVAVEMGTPRDTILAFERDMALLPDHISTIRSWSLGRAVTSQGRRRWTHVLEQEFDDMAGLNGEYMLNPFHWGFADTWYDPESPKRIVEIACVVHAAFERDGAVIS